MGLFVIPYQKSVAFSYQSGVPIGNKPSGPVFMSQISFQKKKQESSTFISGASAVSQKNTPNSTSQRAHVTKSNMSAARRVPSACVEVT